MSYYHDKQKERFSHAEKLLENYPYYIKEFVISLKNADYSSETILSYLSDFSSFFLFLQKCNPICSDLLFKEIPLEVILGISSQDITEYGAFMRSYEDDSVNYQNTAVTRRRKIACLRSFYNYLIDEKMISFNPVLKRHTPKIKKKEVVYVPSDNMQLALKDLEQKYLELLDDQNTCKTLTKNYEKAKNKMLSALRTYTIVLLLYSTGIRVSECCGLNMESININEGKLFLVRKGGGEDVVYLPERTMDVLSLYIKDVRPHYRPKEQSEDSNSLFFSQKHTRLSVRQIERIIKDVMMPYGEGKNITPHKLRSSYATALYKSTGNIYLVSKNLNHSSLETSLRYVHSSEDEKLQGSEEIGKLLE